MSDIVLSMQSGEPVASSRQIADNFEKRHDHVMRDIPSASFDTWVAKCVCLCLAIDRNVPEFIIKRLVSAGDKIS